MEVTTTGSKAGKFDARFYHLVFEEEIGRVKDHFGPINSLAFHPDGKRWVLGLGFPPDVSIGRYLKTRKGIPN